MNGSLDLIRRFSTYKGWLFPAVLTVVLVVLTLLSISGTSLGVYDSLLGETNHNLITGTARPDRSDEWLVNTPLTLSQKANNYKTINPDIGKGNDSAVVVDVPYKDWSLIFKPQNLAFFLLPTTMAFAFKWWLLAYLLMMSIYLLFLTLFPKRYFLASALALFFCFSPYIQWWYQSTTVLSVAYSLFLVCLAVRTLETKRMRFRIILGGTLAYVMACFGILLYPPYQIPSALVALAVFISIYASRRDLQLTSKAKQAISLGVPLLIALTIFGAFLTSHRGAVLAEAHTIYPGHRVVHAGGTSFAYVSEWPLSRLLQRGGPVSVFGDNQSESAEFLFFGVLLLPYLLFYLFGAMLKRLQSSKHENLKLLQCLLAGSGIVLLIFALRMFVPFGDGLYHLLGLSSVPQNRLFLAIGILNMIFIAIAVQMPARKYSGIRSLWSFSAASMAALSIIVLTLGLRAVKHTYGLPVDVGHLELGVVILCCSLIVGLLCHDIRQARYIGLMLALTYSLFAALQVNPLYHGFGSILDSRLSHSVSKVQQADPQARWVVSNKIPLEAVPMALGAKSLSGVYPYPQSDLWNHYFPGSNFVYNRFAHVTFNVNDSVSKRSLRLVQGDTFQVNLPSCDSFLKDFNVRYIIAVGGNADTYNCYKQRDAVKVGQTSVNIYVRR